MPKILVIGSGSIRNLCQEALVSSGYNTLTFDSLDKAFPVLDDKADLIIADKKLSSDPASWRSSRGYRSRLPKLVLSRCPHFLQGHYPLDERGSVVYPLFDPDVARACTIS